MLYSDIISKDDRYLDTAIRRILKNVGPSTKRLEMPPVSSYNSLFAAIKADSPASILPAGNSITLCCAPCLY